MLLQKSVNENKNKKCKKYPNNPTRKKKCNWLLTWKIGLSLQTSSTITRLLQKKELSSICPNYLIKNFHVWCLIGMVRKWLDHCWTVYRSPYCWFATDWYQIQKMPHFLTLIVSIQLFRFPDLEIHSNLSIKTLKSTKYLN